VITDHSVSVSIDTTTTALVTPTLPATIEMGLTTCVIAKSTTHGVKRSEGGEVSWAADNPEVWDSLCHEALIRAMTDAMDAAMGGEWHDFHLWAGLLHDNFPKAYAVLLAEIHSDYIAKEEEAYHASKMSRHGGE
jgi:hypothetical protein